MEDDLEGEVYGDSKASEETCTFVARRRLEEVPKGTTHTHVFYLTAGGLNGREVNRNRRKPGSFRERRPKPLRRHCEATEALSNKKTSNGRCTATQAASGNRAANTTNEPSTRTQGEKNRDAKRNTKPDSTQQQGNACARQIQGCVQGGKPAHTTWATHRMAVMTHERIEQDKTKSRRQRRLA